MTDSAALIRYAARRRGRQRDEQGRPGAFRELAEAAMLPVLLDDARSRLPARAGSFHKGTLALNALAALAAADPRTASLLIERCRRLVALRARFCSK